MSSLSTVEARLLPGFRFHPRDEELICDYLMNRVMGFADHRSFNTPPLIEVDLNKCEPWDIPETACVGGKEWYFYSQRDRKYATGKRTNRATISGYWKATGKDRPIFRKGTLVGMRKTLVFYQGRAPKGTKTDWVMHEFRLEGPHGPGPETTDKVHEDWVLCRVFYKKMSSEVSGKQGTITFEETSSSSLSSLLPGILIQPYTTIFEQTDQQASTNHQQVSCFSNISTTSQTSPTFSLITDVITGGLIPHDHSTGDHINPSVYCHSDYKNANIRAHVLMNHLNRLQSAANYDDDQNIDRMMTKDTSGSFGAGSNSDSYLSEVDLFSMWNNQYS